MAFWEDIVHVLSLGADNSSGLSNQIQEMYSQLPAPEIKATPAIQSNVNLQKASLRLSRLKESSKLQFGLKFKYDTVKPTRIKLYWGAKELPIKDENGNLTYRFAFGKY